MEPLKTWTLEIDPKPKPRMTLKSSRFAHSDYWTFKDDIVKLANSVQLTDLPPRFKVVFHIPFPKSYPKKNRKKLLGKPYQVNARNDVDNLAKAVMDCLCKNGDSYIYEVLATKVWAREGEGKIVISEMLPDGLPGEACNEYALMDLLEGYGIGKSQVKMFLRAIDNEGLRIV